MAWDMYGIAMRHPTDRAAYTSQESVNQRPGTVCKTVGWGRADDQPGLARHRWQGKITVQLACSYQRCLTVNDGTRRTPELAGRMA
jgi:hypothetical protein